MQFLSSLYTYWVTSLTNGLTPDYLVEAQQNGSFYLEVASVSQPPENLKAQMQVNGLLDKLNSIAVPFAISLQLNSWPAAQLSPAKIARNIEHKLKVALNAGTADSVSIDLSEYNLDGTLLAKYSEGAVKALAMCNFPVGNGLPSLPTMTDALKKKINKYKNLDQPYVIWICSTDLFPLNELTLESILYGQEVLTIDLQSGAEIHTRDYSGLLPPKPGSDKALNTRVSAVLYAEMERQDDDLIFTTKLFHNPWAKKPFPEDVFSDIPQLVKVPSEGGQTKLRWTIEPVNRWKSLFQAV